MANRGGDGRAGDAKSVIPVLGRDPRDVTGVQPRDVHRVKEVLRAADAARLDPRHKGEDNGEDVGIVCLSITNQPPSTTRAIRAVGLLSGHSDGALEAAARE